jgi:tripartite ATP-independent transporter DctM subunit
MSWDAAAWLMLGGSTLLLFLGLPVAFSFLVINLLGAWLFLGGEAGLVQLARNSVGSVASFSLTPIPLFILMGEVLFHTGLAVKVIEGVERLIRQVPGRLAVVAVVAGTVFSAISGSTIATTAMLGSLMLPVMLSRGYHPTMATGPLMAIGAVDMLIPPSALTVLLGSLSGISISKLLIGGVMPGLILSLAFVVYIIARVKMNPALAPTAEFTAHRGWDKWRPFVQYVIPLVSIFVVVVASMSAGWATPTESAAIGAFFTMILAVAYRSLTLRNLFVALRGTAAISGMILFIIVGATTFSQILSFSGASNGMVETIGPLAPRGDRGDDGAARLPRPVRRAGEHDDDHAADLHAARAEVRRRPGVVRRHVPHLHAARAAAAAARPASHDDEGRRPRGSAHGAHLPGGAALHRDEPAAPRARVLRPGGRGVAA